MSGMNLGSILKSAYSEFLSPESFWVLFRQKVPNESAHYYYLKNFTINVATVPVTNAHQRISVIVINQGQFFIKTWFVRSYVLYAKNQSIAPRRATSVSGVFPPMAGMMTKYSIPKI